MVTKEQIKKAKTLPMAALLEYLGYIPAEQRGSELIYFSPFRNEKTPSFSVNVKGNVCNDFGDREKSGDVIRLYQNLTKCTFLQAVHDLCNNKINASADSSFLKYEPIMTKEKKQAEIVEIKDRITNKSLIHYLESRCINIQTANQYCKEIHYKQANGKIYHSIGFKNDAEGYELRSANFKSCVGKKDITTIQMEGVQKIRAVRVFEGFLDFLSWLEYSLPKVGKVFHAYDICVLNSTSLLSRFSKYYNSKEYRTIATYFDNDDSGKKCELELNTKHPFEKIIHQRERIAYKTDLNDYLIEKLSK